MTTRFATARAVLLRAIDDRAFPAAVIEVGDATRPIWQEAFGTLTFEPGAAATRDDTIFDLASLTKVLATTPLLMREVERGGLALDEPISRYLERWDGAERATITIRDLLAHCGGLAAHVPLYLEHHGRRAFAEAIATLPLSYQPRTASIYSDLGFMLLGFILDTDVAGLAERFDAMLAQLGGIQELSYGVAEHWRPRIAPTGVDAWRPRRLAGEVNDANAFALDGVAGHAGLFGTAAAVGDCARHVLQILDHRVGIVRRETLATFIARREEIPGSSRALGWDTMLPTSSCGTRMSPGAFGHTGYTGTSLWIDPIRGVYVVLLTNRVYPDATNTAITQVRPAVHDAVIDALDMSTRSSAS